LLDTKEILIEKLKFARICNMDAFKFLSCIFDSRGRKDNYDTFIYCDPPYSISKGGLNDNKGWNIDKLEQLIDKLLTLNCLFAISEYNDCEIIELAKAKGLKINYIAKAGFNKVVGKSEILMTNYEAESKNEKDLFDLLD
jgi:site-specific DNA-adenine methylase